MNVYEVNGDLACGVFTRVRGDGDRAEWERRNELAGKPAAAQWHPPRLESSRGKPEVLPADCVSAAMIGTSMLLGIRAREVLAPLLLPCGEYLPVLLEGLDYHWFKCAASANVADQDRIEGRLATESHMPPGWWDRITRWAFHPERLADAPTVFTVPQQRDVLMCTDVLRDAVEAHDLLGFQFDLLWSPEGGGVEIDNSLGQFFGKSGRQMTIAGRERRRVLQKRLAARAKAEAAAAFPT